MKALLIKYHGPTNTKGSRLSVQSQGFRPIYKGIDNSMDIGTQVWNLANDYFTNRFCIKNPNFAMGTLPNGDDVAVLI